ncbi:MAG: HAD hydrolase family protein [Candidatus Aminicenantes bacterium]|nr:HAD hydrolase family protein [Candidatus Aminicenantes bacterium]
MRLHDKARPVKLILMDVDGTLTDGALFVLPDGEEVKGYNVRDGMGILMARRAGLEVGVITGKASRGFDHRAARLRLAEIHQSVADKGKVLAGILERRKLAAAEVAYIGDDLNDLDVLRAVGLSGAVADAHPLVRRCCDYVCRLPGGRGAVREFIELIIRSQGKWDAVMADLSTLLDLRGRSAAPAPRRKRP